MTTGERELKAAGFQVHHTFPGGRWFEVTAPDGEHGAVLRQSRTCWHYFAKEYQATASDSTPGMCHRGGLGDAISTDAQERTYRRLLQEEHVPRGVLEYAGVYAAIGQVSSSR